jgi:curli biogenesis system outer membrane secretion channel CsgG
MNMKIITSLVLAGILTLPAAAQQRTVEVQPFDYSTVMTSIQAIFGTQVDLGRGIQALMVNRITKGGKFTVVERSKVKTLLAEQDFGASGRVKRGSQARIGELKGAQFTIFGDIVTFGRDDRKKSGGIIAVVPGAGGAAGGYKSQNKAVVTINFRMVNTETSEVVMTGEATGESKRESKGGFAGLIVPGFGAGVASNMSTSNFAETIIGEAIIDACDKLASQVESQAGKVQSTINAQIEGYVASVDGSTAYLNVGSAAGVQVGDVFMIAHVVKEVRDPVSKEVLDLQTEPAGTMKVLTVRDKISIGTVTGGPARVGDRAEKR